MKKLKLILLLLLIISCQENNRKSKFENFTELQFALKSSWRVAYNMKILNSGECFILDISNEQKYYFLKLKDTDISYIDSLVSKLSKKNESFYQDNLEDASDIKINILLNNKDTITKSIYGHATKDIDNLVEFLNSIFIDNKKTNLIRIDTNIQFIEDNRRK